MHSKISRAYVGHSGKSNTFRSGLILLVSATLIGLETVPAFGQGSQEPAPSSIEGQVKKFGVGKSVKIWLVSGEFITGHIRTISTDSFTVKISKTHTERSIPYSQVTEIKDPSPLTWMLIGAAVVIVIILIAHH